MNSKAITILFLLWTTSISAQQLPKDVSIALIGQAKSTDVVVTSEDGFALPPFNLKTILEQRIASYLEAEYSVEKITNIPNISSHQGQGTMLAIAVYDLNYFKSHWGNFQVPGRLRITAIKDRNRLEESFNLNISGAFEHSMFSADSNAKQLTEKIPEAIAKKIMQSIDEILNSAEGVALFNGDSNRGSVVVRRNEGDVNQIQINPGQNSESAIVGQALLGALNSATSSLAARANSNTFPQSNNMYRGTNPSPSVSPSVLIDTPPPQPGFDRNASSGGSVALGTANSSPSAGNRPTQRIASFKIVREGLFPSRSGSLGNEYIVEILNDGNVPLSCSYNVQYTYLSSGDSRVNSKSVMVRVQPSAVGIGSVSHADDVIQGRRFPTNITQYSPQNFRCTPS